MMYRQRFKTTVERFFEKVEKSASCWIWFGSGNRYGHFFLQGKHIKAHRFSWELVNGDIPLGKIVCHKCDNGLCVNPEHLFIGTQKDNMMDCSRKGRLGKTNRAKPGEKHHFAKLTFNDVVDIRTLLSFGVMQKKLADEFLVSEAQIYRIRKGLRWA